MAYNPGLEYAVGEGLEVNSHPQDQYPRLASPTEKERHDAPAYQGVDQKPQRRSRFPILPILFGFVAGFVVAAAALGGGLGASLASCSHDKDQLQHQLATPTGSTSANCTAVAPNADLSNYTVAAAKTVTSVFADCPAIDNSAYTTLESYAFDIRCGINPYAGTPAAEGGVIADIAGSVTYSWQDCVESCGRFNTLSASKSNPDALLCRSVSFDRNMSYYVQNFGINCWLKNGTLAQGQTGATGQFAVSAFLKS